MEQIIKLKWMVKKTPTTLKCMKEYTEQELINVISKAFNNSRKANEEAKKPSSDKVDIITAIVNDDDTIKYKHYYFDNKTDFTHENCIVNINIKTENKNKKLTYEEKVELLTSFLKKKLTIPKPGDLMNDFDVGKFYQQSIQSGSRMKEIKTIVSQFVENYDEDNEE